MGNKSSALLEPSLYTITIDQSYTIPIRVNDQCLVGIPMALKGVSMTNFTNFLNERRVLFLSVVSYSDY